MKNGEWVELHTKQAAEMADLVRAIHGLKDKHRAERIRLAEICLEQHGDHDVEPMFNTCKRCGYDDNNF